MGACATQQRVACAILHEIENMKLYAIGCALPAWHTNLICCALPGLANIRGSCTNMSDLAQSQHQSVALIALSAMNSKCGYMVPNFLRKNGGV